MKKIIEKLKSLDKGTILRTVLMILTLANQVVALIGSTSFAAAAWYQWLSFGLTLAMMVVSYWYNNDWTKLAQLSRDIFDMLKDGKIKKEEIEEFLKNKNGGKEHE